MRFPVDEDAFETTLEKVPDPLVAMVELRCVDPVEMVNAAREVWLGSLYEQMVVVCHEYKRMETPPELEYGIRQ